VSETDYSDYSKSDLQAAADEQGIEYDDSDTKAELIAKLEDAEAGDDESAETADEETAEDGTGEAAAGPFPSEQFPERAPVEVDVADVPVEEHEGEYQAPLNAESWAVLDGSSDQVPDELDGAVAAIIDWPVGVEHDSSTGETKTFTAPDGYYLVQDRAQGTRLSVTADAFKEIHTHGRPGAYA